MSLCCFTVFISPNHHHHNQFHHPKRLLRKRPKVLLTHNHHYETLYSYYQNPLLSSAIYTTNNTMAMNIVRRIFSNRPLPSQDVGEEEFKKQFDQAVTDFENSGYLEENKLEPINTEYDLVERLHQHKKDLIVVKFWKRGCLPCLGLAEMYKQAELQLKGQRVHFFSINSKEDSCLPTIAHQLIEGTPTVQLFHDGKQIGDEVMATNLNSFLEKINGYKKEVGIDK